MQKYEIIMPSATAEKRFAAAATTLQQVAVDCKTVKLLQDAMKYLVSPIVLAPENITETWKRDPCHPMFEMATANKLRFNRITGPLRMIYYQAMFVAAAVNQQLADRAQELMHELQQQYRQYSLADKLEYIARLDALIIQFLSHVKTSNYERATAN